MSQTDPTPLLPVHVTYTGDDIYSFSDFSLDVGHAPVDVPKDYEVEVHHDAVDDVDWAELHITEGPLTVSIVLGTRDDIDRTIDYLEHIRARVAR